VEKEKKGGDKIGYRKKHIIEETGDKGVCQESTKKHSKKKAGAV